MVKRRLIDLQFAVAIIDVTTDGDPILTIMIPESESSEPNSIDIWGSEGLRNLAASLHEALDEFDNEP